MSNSSSDEDFRPPASLTNLSVSSTGSPSVSLRVPTFETPQTETPRPPLRKNKSWLSTIRKRLDRVGMTTPSKESRSQGASSGQDNPQQGGSAGTEAVIIGAPAIPPQVLAAVAEEDLPVWFKPFWEHLCSLRDTQAKELADTRKDVMNIQRAMNRLLENDIRTKGVEMGLSQADGKIDQIVEDGKSLSNQIQSVDKRIDEQEKKLEDVKSELGRALAARPAATNVGAPSGARDNGAQGTTKQEGEAAPHNPSVTFWPGSAAPPPNLPPMSAAFGASSTVGQPVAAHEETKPDLGGQWSSTHVNRSPRLGPLVPHLEPLTTILQPFQTVMDYRHYRLNDMTEVPTEADLKHMYKIKEKAEGRHRGLAVFDATDPMKLFEFLSIYKRAMNDMGKSEAVAVRALTHFLDEDAKDAYNMQMTSDLSFSDGQDVTTWSHVVNCLLSTFITDDLLQTAYNEVIQARQRQKESVADFITRLQDLAKQCHGVFPQAEMANMVLLGMKPAIRHRIQHAVNNLAPHEKISLPKIRQLAVQEDNAQRAQALEFTHSSSTGPRGGRKAGEKASKTLHIGGPAGGIDVSPPTTPTPSQTSTRTEDRPMNRAHDPVGMVEAAAGLSALFALTEQPVRKAIERNKLDPTSIMQTMNSLPGLTDEQLDQAMSVIPSDYWRLTCWTCREKGHMTYICPYLEPKQRVFFAYCYYMHQVQNNPELKAWYKKRLDFFRGQGPAPGPRPGSDYQYDGMRGGRGRGPGRGGGGLRLHQRAQPTLPAPAPVAGALPAPEPVAQKAPEAPTPVAVVQETSSSDSSRSSGNE